MTKNAKTLNSISNATRTAAINRVADLAESRPGDLAPHLAKSPNLANGLKDLDYIIEKLLEAGFKYEIMCMLECKSLRKKERMLIAEQVLFS